MLNSDVIRNGPLWPVRIFKHASQAIYNKTKGGVDRNAQMRAILSFPTGTLKCEQKIVTQVFRSIAINAGVASRQLEKEELLESRESFKGLDAYRNALDKVESLAEFIFELISDLLKYAEQSEKDLNSPNSPRGKPKENKLKKKQVKRLISKAKGRHRYRTTFLNGEDGITLRLHVKGNDHCTTEVRCSTLCGGNNHSRFRGDKICTVNLYVKVSPGFRRACWDVWHTVKLLKYWKPKAIQHIQYDDQEDESATDERLKDF